MTGEIKVSPEAKVRYLQRRIQEVIDCHSAITKEDFKFIERVGHTIKGNAETFGFVELVPLGTKLEKQALNQEVEKIVSTLNEIEIYLKKQS